MSNQARALFILSCTFFIGLPSLASAQTTKELRAVIKPYTFGSAKLFNQTIHEHTCAIGTSCIGALESIFIIHQKSKHERDVYVVDSDAIYTMGLQEKYGKHVTSRFIRLHLKMRRAKLTTIPCNTARAYPNLVWKKEVKTFAVKDLRLSKGQRARRVKVTESSPLKANQAYASAHRTMYKRGPKEYGPALFEPAELKRMQDPSFRQPTLRLKSPSVTFGGSKAQKRRVLMMGALWSPESNRVHHFSHLNKFQTTGKKSKKEQKRVKKLEDSMRFKIMNTLLHTFKKTKIKTIRVDLKTACEVPELFNLDKDQLVVID